MSGFAAKIARHGLRLPSLAARPVFAAPWRSAWGERFDGAFGPVWAALPFRSRISVAR